MRLFALILLIALPALAQNVDLSTLPPRDSVQLTIYNAEDLTLVRETRSVTFRQGDNPLQFSWANTQIDPTSVKLRFLDQAGKLSVLDTTFPHDKPQMLYWNVSSEFSGQATVEVTYFTSGIAWSSDYLMLLSPDEQTAEMTGYVTVTNNSGEDYENAQVRLVVGRVNLVEKIAVLAMRWARVPLGGVAGGLSVFPEDGEVDADAIYDRPSFDRSSALGLWRQVEAEKEVIKQGLSEYFIFTVEGRETVPTGWSKRMRSSYTEAAPVETVYRYRPRQYGVQLVRVLLVENTEEAGLGESPMPDGVVRIYAAGDNGSSSFVAQLATPYVPIGEEMELNTGHDPRVWLETTALWQFRDRQFVQLDGVDVLRRVDGPGGVEVDVRSRLVGWDQHTIYRERVRNSSDRDITVEMRRPFGGDSVFTADLETERYDAATVAYDFDVEPGGEREMLFQHTLLTGRNARQSRLDIVAGEPRVPPWMAGGDE